jgi:hypothetical protein
MPRKVSLNVNNNPIEVDNFVEGFVYHITVGILASLKDTGAIKNLELNVDGDGQVDITLNGAEVPLSYFPVQIIRNTLAGMVSNLKGVTEPMRTLELKITQ